MGLAGWSGLGSLQAERAGWERWVLAGHLCFLCRRGPFTQSLRVGWLGFLPAWPFRAPDINVPGETRRSYIAFGVLAQKPEHCFCKFKSTQIQGQGTQKVWVSMGGAPAFCYKNVWDDRYCCGPLWEMQPVTN